MTKFLAILVALASCIDPYSDSSLDSGTIALTDPAVPWIRHTIADDLKGADGHVIRGSRIAVAWEESSRVTIYDAGILVGSYAHSSAEDVAFCDLDGDGDDDVLSAGEGKQVKAAQNTGAGFAAPITIANGFQQFTSVDCGHFDGAGSPIGVVAGGRVPVAPLTTASVYLFRYSGVSPWSGGWAATPIASAGWTLDIVARDLNGDGSDDVTYSDRQQASASVSGIRTLTRTASGWSAATIAPVVGSVLPKFFDGVPGTLSFLWGGSKSNGTGSEIRSGTGGGTLIPYPSNVGPYQALARADVDGDGLLDVVLSTGIVGGTPPPASASYVVWLRAPTWARFEISGPDGEKGDNVTAGDYDADGDPDVMVTEQSFTPSAGNGLGLVWYENPTL